MRSFVVYELRDICPGYEFITRSEPLLCLTLLHLFESTLSSLNSISPALRMSKTNNFALVLVAALTAFSLEH